MGKGRGGGQGQGAGFGKNRRAIQGEAKINREPCILRYPDMTGRAYQNKKERTFLTIPSMFSDVQQAINLKSEEAHHGPVLEEEWGRRSKRNLEEDFERKSPIKRI